LIAAGGSNPASKFDSRILKWCLDGKGCFQSGRMAIGEKALKRARDFFSTSLKAKHRFAALKSFQGNTIWSKFILSI
jgi:hypothetical protein